MKKIIFVILSLIKISGLVAQQHNFTISLANSDRLLQIPLNSYISKIIDARKNKTKIGTFYNKNQMSNIIFKKSIEDELFSVFPIQKHNTLLKKIIFRINDIYLDEIKEHSIISSHISITFIEQKDNEFIELFTATEAITGKISILDKKGFLSDLIVQNLDNCIKSFIKRFKTKKTLNHKIDTSQLFIAQMPYSLPKLSNLKKGVYQTFYDFRDNTPDSIKEEIKYKRIPNQIHELGFLSSSQNQWGFFDGKKLFVKSIENSYVPIIEDQNRIIYYEKLSSFSYKKEANNDVIYPIIISSGAIGGALGGLIAAMIANNEKSNNQKEVTFSLNINKGAFELTENVLDTAAKFYIINSTFTNNPSVSIEINGNKFCSIFATEYLKYYPSKFEENINICLNFENQEKVCQTTVINSLERVYLTVNTNDGRNLNMIWEKEKIVDNKLFNKLKEKEYTLGCSLTKTN